MLSWGVIDRGEGNMKKGLITLLIIAMLACIGMVSCKNEVQAPAEGLVSVGFSNSGSRALSSNLEAFKYCRSCGGR